MNRRDALKTSSLLLGYTITGGTAIAVLNGCKADPSIDWSPNNLNTNQVIVIAELVESIIPQTDTPGAKEAQVDRFIDAILDCYSPEEKTLFISQLDAFSGGVVESHGKSFDGLAEADRVSILEKMSQDSNSSDHDFFKRIKELTVVGYCTSELGATQHLNWDPVPGAPYQGCIEFSEVGKTWAL